MSQTRPLTHAENCDRQRQTQFHVSAMKYGGGWHWSFRSADDERWEITTAEVIIAKIRERLPLESRRGPTPEPWRCQDCGQGYPCECRLMEQDAELDRAARATQEPA